ncbi:MAG TPA: PQQ-binding-like beta-propeller repeat protein [Thermoanaerobaculia bacterium]|nr:PQQ-binding-like beta-propeller repeat protein [Thermoanaerobaculia bacterium]
MRRTAILGGVLAVLTGGAGWCQAQEWPQWAGPARNWTSDTPETAGVFQKGTLGLKLAWKRPLAAGEEGISALTVHGDRLYSLSSTNGNAHAFALDAATGKEVWRVPVGTVPPDQEFGAASTPATDGRRVYVVSPTCVLSALDAADGKTVWSRDFKTDFANKVATGCWNSPLLEGNLVIAQVNGDPDKRVVAFDKGSGEVVWSAAGTVKSALPSPALFDFGGVRQVLVHESQKGQGGLYGLRLQDGALLWTARFEDPESYSFDTPIAMPGGRIAVVGWSDFRVAQVRATQEKDKPGADQLWKSREIRAEVQPFTSHAVYHGEHLYGFGGENLVCLDAATGKTVWREKVYPGSLILVDGHLVVLSQAAGLLRVVEATPAGYREKARLEVFTPGAPTDTPPSFAGRRVYLRNSEEIAAVEVTSR